MGQSREGCYLPFEREAGFRWEHVTYPVIFLLNVFLLVELLPRSRSVAAVEEECNSADDEPGGLSVGGHLQSAEELLSVEIEVEGSLNDALRIRIWLALRYPGKGTDW